MATPQVCEAPSPAPLALVIASAGAWAVVLLVLLILAPAAREHFVDFGVALPRLTVGILDFSRWLAGSAPGAAIPGLVIAAPVALLLFGTAVLAHVRIDSRGLGPALLHILLWTGVLVVLLVAGSLAVPLLRMLEAMQGAGGI
ncbi:MAG: hypothetical protein SFY69_07095 [Planctomycetota bacterium]|nr:hypothetical protein [Planctomycetota bacterium]